MNMGVVNVKAALTMKNKYLVTVVRTGCVFIEADDESQALDIANHLKTDSVYWSDDWDATDVVEDDSALDNMYISEREFE